MFMGCQQKVCFADKTNDSHTFCADGGMQVRINPINILYSLPIVHGIQFDIVSQNFESAVMLLTCC